jgi:hypothetical protein
MRHDLHGKSRKNITGVGVDGFPDTVYQRCDLFLENYHKCNQNHQNQNHLYHADTAVISNSILSILHTLSTLSKSFSMPGK